ncbi:MAG: phosphomannomutase/phosphoglucomutase [Clostridia bacterium]|nr:phosphomannomutase/phosphoglucomutase [Clostridia bacterium]
MTLQKYLQLKNGTDVRGVAVAGVENQPVTLTEDIASDIAAAFCLWLGQKLSKDHVSVAVGYDSRISAPALSKAVLAGITKTGGKAVDTGLSTTPSMFMLLKDETRLTSLPCDGSIMITASHLPFNRNGLKFFTAQGGLESADITQILTLAAEGTKTKTNGEIVYAPYVDNYAKSLVEKVRKATGDQTPLKGKRIVVDAGNGAGGFFADKVLAPLGADTTGSQFLEPDGRFPNHIPNPEDGEAMRSVCEAVKKANADFGIIFDTDVDRAGAVDERGEEINRNRLIALISAILLQEKKGTIVTDSVTSDGLAVFLKDAGGKHHRFKRGYKNVINEAIRLNALGEYTPLAIETSGHAALMENYFLDDGAYLIVRLLIALAKAGKEGKRLTDLIATLPEAKEGKELRVKFVQGVDFKTLGKGVIDDFAAFASTQEYLRPADDNFEGFRVNFDKAHGDGWALLRMSLHDPNMPVNIESDSAGGVKAICTFLYQFLSLYDFLDLTAFENFLKA